MTRELQTYRVCCWHVGDCYRPKKINMLTLTDGHFCDQPCTVSDERVTSGFGGKQSRMPRCGTCSIVDPTKENMIQRRMQRAFGGMYTTNHVVRAVSPPRWLDPGGPNLQGVLRACPRLASRKNFFDPSTFKKLTFSEPRMLKLGWWGGQITTICMFLFKKPN